MLVLENVLDQYQEEEEEGDRDSQKLYQRSPKEDKEHLVGGKRKGRRISLDSSTLVFPLFSIFSSYIVSILVCVSFCVGFFPCFVGCCSGYLFWLGHYFILGLLYLYLYANNFGFRVPCKKRLFYP